MPRCSCAPKRSVEEDGVGPGFAVFGEDGDAGIAVGEGLNVELGAGHAVAGDVAVESAGTGGVNRARGIAFDDQLVAFDGDVVDVGTGGGVEVPGLECGQ